MKKTILSVLAACMICPLLAGCGTDPALEDRIAGLEEQIAILQERVDTLEAEKSTLQIENIGTVTLGSNGSAELRLNDWTEEDGNLIVDLFIRMDDIAQEEAPDVHLLLHQGDVLHELAVEVYPGEADGSFEAELSAATFELPDLDAGEELELELVVTLQNGEELRTGGIGWYQEDGVLYQISG